MKVNPTDATMPQPRPQGQQQQPSKPKPKSNDDFKKIFEAEVKKRYGDKIASKVIFL